MKTVYCKLLQETKKGLLSQPFPGVLGKKIYEEISQEGWDIWIEQQTRMINEHRLDLSKPEDRKWLMELMEEFLFTD